MLVKQLQICIQYTLHVLYWTKNTDAHNHIGFLFLRNALPQILWLKTTHSQSYGGSGVGVLVSWSSHLRSHKTATKMFEGCVLTWKLDWKSLLPNSVSPMQNSSPWGCKTKNPGFIQVIGWRLLSASRGLNS